MIDIALFTYRAQIVEAKSTPHGVERDLELAKASGMRTLLKEIGATEEQLKQTEKEAYAMARAEGEKHDPTYNDGIDGADNDHEFDSAQDC